MENLETISWLDFLTRGEPEDIDESEQRYLINLKLFNVNEQFNGSNKIIIH